MSPTSITRWILICIVLLSCFNLGCSETKPPSGVVSGAITFDGAPYSDCKAGIHSPGAMALGTRVDAEGKFTINNVPPGEYSVMVFPIPVDGPENGPDPPDTSPIPKSFRSDKTTEISVSVKAGEVSEINIELSE